MSRTDDGSGVAKCAQAVGRRRLRGEVVAEHREPVVIQAGGEVGDVAADDEPLADAHRLVAGRVTGRQQQLDRSVAEQVVVAVDEHDLVANAAVVDREVEVPA